MFILLHLINFSITYFVCHDGRCENSAHRRSLASRLAPPPCQHQWAAAGIFWRLDLISFVIFAHVYFTTSDNFFNNILCAPWWDMWNLSPQKEFGILTHTTALPTSMGSGRCILKVRFIFLCHFRSCLLFYIWLFFRFCTFSDMTGKMKTQPTDWIWRPDLYMACKCCLYLLLITLFLIRLQLTFIWLIVFVMQWSVYWFYC